MAQRTVRRVVVQYRHRGYSPPEDDPLITFALDAEVTHADVDLGIVEGTLLSVRDALKGLGFEQHGAHPISGQTRRHQRWNPLWREVWVQETAQ
jgi:hypothetical protein